MRIVLVFLIAAFCCAGRCGAEELVLGRVVSIDKDAGTVSMEVVDGPAGMQGDSGDQQKIVTVDRKSLPADIRMNKIVRIWGSVDSKTGRFTAASPGGDAAGRGQAGMSGMQETGPQDTTGVRNRIGRGSAGNSGHGSGGSGGPGRSGGSGAGSGGSGSGGGRGGQGGR